MIIIPTYHPAKLLRDQKMSFAVLNDIKKAVHVQKEGPTIVMPHVPPERLTPLVDTVRAFFEEWRGHPLVCDIEATLTDKVVCVGFWPYLARAWEQSHTGLLVPFLTRGGNSYWNLQELEEVLRCLTDFFNDPAWPKIGQNWVGFDEGLLRRAVWPLGIKAKIEPAGCILDTMVAHALCFPELPHSLAFQASLWTHMGAFKEEVREDDEGETLDFSRILEMDSLSVFRYCLQDCFATCVCGHELEELMR